MVISVIDLYFFNRVIYFELCNSKLRSTRLIYFESPYEFNDSTLTKCLRNNNLNVIFILYLAFQNF